MNVMRSELPSFLKVPLLENSLTFLSQGTLRLNGLCPTDLHRTMQGLIYIKAGHIYPGSNLFSRPQGRTTVGTKEYKEESNLEVGRLVSDCPPP